MTPKHKFQGVGRMEVALLEPDRAMILIPPRDVPPSLSISGGVKTTWGFILDPIDEHSTRLIMRARAESSPRLRDRIVGYAFWEPAHFVMERKMMLAIKQRAETTSRRRRSKPGRARPGWPRSRAWSICSADLTCFQFRGPFVQRLWTKQFATPPPLFRFVLQCLPSFGHRDHQSHWLNRRNNETPLLIEAFGTF